MSNARREKSVQNPARGAPGGVPRVITVDQEKIRKLFARHSLQKVACEEHGSRKIRWGAGEGEFFPQCDKRLTSAT